MKLVLFDDNRLGVINGGLVVDAMEVFEGVQFRRPQDMIEEIITNWEELGPQTLGTSPAKAGQPGSYRVRVSLQSLRH